MRLTDADELKHDLEWLECDTPVYLDVMSTIDERTTVDAVPVVRCKDCIHRMKNGMCEFKNYSVVAQDDNDFCSWGERKEDETD